MNRRGDESAGTLALGDVQDVSPTRFLLQPDIIMNGRHTHVYLRQLARRPSAAWCCSDEILSFNLFFRSPPNEAPILTHGASSVKILILG